MNSLFKTVTGSHRGEKKDEKIIAFQPADDCIQKILIKNLSLMMSIGVLDSEKKSKQRVLVNAELIITPPSNWRADEISDVVSYAEVIEQIKAITDTGHINLAETFAEKIIEECFTHQGVQEVTVSVEKPDILKDVDSVGVCITRRR